MGAATMRRRRHGRQLAAECGRVARRRSLCVSHMGFGLYDARAILGDGLALFAIDDDAHTITAARPTHSPSAADASRFLGSLVESRLIIELFTTTPPRPRAPEYYQPHDELRSARSPSFSPGRGRARLEFGDVSRADEQYFARADAAPLGAAVAARVADQHQSAHSVNVIRFSTTFIIGTPRRPHRGHARSEDIRLAGEPVYFPDAAEAMLKRFGMPPAASSADAERDVDRDAWRRRRALIRADEGARRGARHYGVRDNASLPSPVSSAISLRRRPFIRGG